MADTKPVPPQIIESVERYIDEELADARKYENRWPLDESGISSLHLLVADIYAAGFEAGERVAQIRARGVRQREVDRRNDA